MISFPLDRVRAAGIHYAVDPETVPFPVTRNRLAGFADAAHALGLDWSSIPVAVCSRNRSDDAAQAAVAILNSGYSPEAVVAMSDLQAIAVHHTFGDANSGSSERLRLGGFDGSDSALDRGITSIGQSLQDQGAKAARIALGLEDESGEMVEPWTFSDAEIGSVHVVDSSTRPRRKSAPQN